MNENPNNPERPPKPEKLFPQFEQLPEDDILSVSEKFELSPEEAKEKILRGLNMLGATFVVDGHGGFGLEDIPSIPQREYIEVPIRTPMKFKVGDLGVDNFGIFFHNNELLSLVGASKGNARHYYRLPMSYNGNETHDTHWFYELFDEENFSKVIIPNELYPHPDRTFSYGIYRPDGQLHGIIPFESSEVDREVTAGTLENFQRVFMRKVHTPEDEGLLLQYADEVNQEVTLVNEKLSIPAGFVQNPELILGAKRQFGAFSFVYKDKEQKPHHLLFFSKNRVEDMRDKPANRARVFRHEYLHNLDGALGNGVDTLSELAADEILTIVSKHLFGGRILPKMEHDQSRIDWPDKAKIYTTFTETHFFPGPGLGHPEENIRELFTSAMNIYLDPHFEEALQSRPESERVIIKQLYIELGELVQRRIAELAQQTRDRQRKT